MLSSVLAAAEPSHVPFFIAGGVLAVWALALSFVGMARPQFPFGAVGQRAVMGVSLVLAMAAIVLAIVTSK